MARMRLMLGLVPLSLLLMSGCGSEDDAQSRLTLASAKLQGIPSGKGTIPDAGAVRSVYAEVRELLDPVLERGLPVEQASASLIIAETQLGEGGPAIRALARGEGEALQRLGEVESLLEVWQVAETKREVASSFDASEQIAKLRREMEQFEQFRDEALRERQELQSRLDTVNARIAALLEQAGTQRDEAARLELEAASANVGQVVALVRQAQVHKRKADGLVMEAEKLRGEIERIAPQIDRLTLRIEAAEKDRILRSQNLASIEEIARIRRQASEAARREADGFRDELSALLFDDDGLLAFRTQELTSLLDDAEAVWSRALASARKASSGLRQASQLMAGRIQQAHGQALLQHGQGLTTLRGTLERVAAHDALRNAQLQQAIDEVTQAARDAYQKAADLLQAASDAFGAAGIAGDADDELESLQRSLAAQVQRARDRLQDLGTDQDSDEG